MRRDTGLPPGTLDMLILRVLVAAPLHGYAIAQSIHSLSKTELTVEEGWRSVNRQLSSNVSFGLR